MLLRLLRDCRRQLDMQQPQQVGLGLAQVVAAGQRVAQRQRRGASWQQRVGVVPGGKLHQQAAVRAQLGQQLLHGLRGAKWT